MSKGLALGLFFMLVFLNISSISGNQIENTSNSLLNSVNIDGDTGISASMIDNPFSFNECLLSFP